MMPLALNNWALDINVSAQLHRAVSSTSDSRSEVQKFKSQLGHITLVKIDHEIISAVIFPLLLIQ